MKTNNEANGTHLLDALMHTPEDAFTLARQALTKAEELTHKHSSEPPKVFNAIWIPVEERLPETKCDGPYLKSDKVLATLHDGTIDVAQYWVTIARAGWCLPYKNNYKKVIAWAPLPEPYKK